MRFLAVLVAMCALSRAALAEPPDCKTITDPALRLTCYDKRNPPVATYPIPLPKPSHYVPLTRPDGTAGNSDFTDSGSADDAQLNAIMRNICRGC